MWPSITQNMRGKSTRGFVDLKAVAHTGVDNARGTAKLRGKTFRNDLQQGKTTAKKVHVRGEASLRVSD